MHLSFNKFVYGHQLVPLLQKAINPLPSQIGDPIIFPQPAIMLRGIGRKALGRLQAFEDGIQGGFRDLHMGGDVLDDLIPIGILMEQGCEDADLQYPTF